MALLHRSAFKLVNSIIDYFYLPNTDIFPSSITRMLDRFPNTEIELPIDATVSRRFLAEEKRPFYYYLVTYYYGSSKRSYWMLTFWLDEIADNLHT